MDFAWAEDHQNLSDLLGEESLGVLRLVFLQMRFEGCRRLSDLEALGKSLGTQGKLAAFNISFRGCEQIQDSGIKSLAAGMPKALKVLDVDLLGCKLIGHAGVTALAAKLPTKTLQKVKIVLKG